MKLLLDQNLSFRIVQIIINLFPFSKHVKDFNLENSTDKQIWEFAKENNYIILSKDSDFHQLSFLYGAPPKVIWIRKGNCSTLAMADLISKFFKEIESFSADENSAFLILE